jgi:hypothetical protein
MFFIFKLPPALVICKLDQTFNWKLPALIQALLLFRKIGQPIINKVIAFCRQQPDFVGTAQHCTICVRNAKLNSMLTLQ